MHSHAMKWAAIDWLMHWVRNTVSGTIIQMNKQKKKKKNHFIFEIRRLLSKIYISQVYHTQVSK